MAEVQAGYAVPGAESSVRAVSRSASWRRCLPREFAGRGDLTGALSVRESRPKFTGKFPETLLHAAWRRAGAASATVTGRDGHKYRVIYAGRPADGAGPDFRDAVLLRGDGKEIHGHVEVHVRSGDWHSHGHGSDSAYNGVVLHVVGEDLGPAISTPSGIRVPLLVLDRKFIRQQTPPEKHEPSPTAVPLHELDMGAAGDEWFRNRVHGYLLQLAEDREQALWEGALECLGYPSNKKGFRQLAARLDWVLVSKLTGSASEAGLEALFSWAAGFGAKPGTAPALPAKAPEWSARHGRPANSPRTRLRAAAAWAKRWHKAGRLSEMFGREVRSTSAPGELAAIFLVPAEQNRSAVLGRSRAGDIVVNHLLPAVHALSISVNDRTLADHSKQLFDAHPLLSPNSITREASRLLEARGANGKPRTAREQQGLIHIYRMAVAGQHPERQLPLV